MLVDVTAVPTMTPVPLRAGRGSDRAIGAEQAAAALDAARDPATTAAVLRALPVHHPQIFAALCARPALPASVRRRLVTRAARGRDGLTRFHADTGEVVQLTVDSFVRAVLTVDGLTRDELVAFCDALGRHHGGNIDRTDSDATPQLLLADPRISEEALATLFEGGLFAKEETTTLRVGALWQRVHYAARAVPRAAALLWDDSVLLVQMQSTGGRVPPPARFGVLESLSIEPVARTIDEMLTGEQRHVFAKLWPTWTGTFDELLATCAAITAGS